MNNILIILLLLVSLTASADRFIPTWAVNYEGFDGHSVVKNIDDYEFSIPKTNCVVQRPNAGEGDVGHFTRAVICRNGERHTIDCDATKHVGRKQCHVVAEGFSLNLSIKHLPHLGNRPKVQLDHTQAKSHYGIKGIKATDNNGKFIYRPTWYVSYTDKGGSVGQDIEDALTFKIPGTGCEVKEPNNEMGNESNFSRNVVCPDKTYTINCEAHGHKEKTCTVQDGKRFTISVEITRQKDAAGWKKESLEFDKNHSNTY